MTEQVTIQLRDGLSTGATGWTSVNPILAAGEPGFEIDTDTLKIGDGVTRWNDLELLRFGTRVAFGKSAGLTGQEQSSVALGEGAGQILQAYSSTNDGNLSGVAGYSVAIGFRAGQSNQREQSIAIGYQAGQSNQRHQSIAIGTRAGIDNQGPNSIAIGSGAGQTNQGSNSIAIGKNAGYGPITLQPSNTIILNASGAIVNGVPNQTNSLYVTPIRQDLTKTIPLLYDPLTYEIVQGTPSTPTNPITLRDSGSFTLGTANPAGWPYSPGDVGVTFLGPYTTGLYSFAWSADGLQFGNGSFIAYYPPGEGFKGGYDFGGPTNIQVFGSASRIGFVNYGSPGTWKFWLHKFTNS